MSSVTIGQILFDRKYISISLRWPFLLSRTLGDAGDYLGTVNSQNEFRKGLRRHLKGRDAGKHLSSALYRELKAFTILFTKAHRWGETVVDGLNSVGERRMAGRRSSIEIETQEANRIRRQAQIILAAITEINRRAKTLRSRGPDLQKKILKDYIRDQFPWIGSLFPVLRDLHGEADTPQSRPTNNSEIGCRNHSKRNIQRNPGRGTPSAQSDDLLSTSIKLTVCQQR